MENTADALVLLTCTTRRVSIPEKLKNTIGRCDNDTFNDNDTYHHHQLDEAMRKHIEYLVYKEWRPFSFRNFNFEVNELQYHMSHGIFRNKVSVLLKNGKIDLAYYSTGAFYMLKDFECTKHFPLVRIMLLKMTFEQNHDYEMTIPMTITVYCK